MEIKIAGIDYSLTCPCVAIYCGDADKFSFEACRFFYLIDSKKYADDFLNHQIQGDLMPLWKTDEERYDRISKWAMEIISDFQIESVTVEGYSMGSKGRVFNLAENCGILKWKIWKAGIGIDIVPPTTVKKFATGKGNSDKDKMFEAFLQETSIDIQKIICPDKAKVSSPVGDIVDAYYILKYGLTKQ
jgi:hypothetical protein